MGHAEFAPSPVPSPFTIRKVIFATDFSSCSENAGAWAAMIALQFKADLCLAHAFELSQAAMEVEAEGHGSRKSAQRTEYEALLSREAGHLGSGLDRVETVLLEGDPREKIPEIANTSESTLVVLGSQGRGRVSRGIIGSVAERVLRATPGPSLTVGPHVPRFDRSRPIKRVLCATGLSPAAARGAAYAIGMAQAFGAELDVLHVVHPEDVEKDGLAAVQNRFQLEVDSILPAKAEPIVKPHGVIATGVAHARIHEHIEKHAIDLLVLSLRRSSHLWFESRISGAFQIIVNAPCPVMTLVG